MNRMLLTQLSANDESGVVVKVLRGVGDAVAVGDVVLEIETTKAVLEVPSSLSGTISYIAPAASRLRLGDCMMEVDGEVRAPAPAAEGRTRTVDESIRRRMSDEALALVEASGQDVVSALPSAGLITAKLVRSILEGRSGAAAAAPAPVPDLEAFLAARSNEKFCAHMASRIFGFRPDVSEDLLIQGIGARSPDFLALLSRGRGGARFSLSVVADLDGIPLLVEIDPESLRTVQTVAEAKLEKILQLRRRGRPQSFAARSSIAISTLGARHVSHHYPIVPENHAAVFGLLISPRGCSVTIGYDHRRLSGINAAKMLDLAVSLLAGED